MIDHNGCKGVAWSRGVCLNCRALQRRNIRLRYTTEEQLIAEGKLKPAKVKTAKD